MKFYLGYIVILMGLLFGVVFIIGGITMDTEDRIVDCFDKYGNKIIGETCLDEYEPGMNIVVSIIGFFAMILIILAGIVIVNSEKQLEEK